MTLLTPTPAPILSAGDLHLDTGGKVLTGPAGSVDVPVGLFPILRLLMGRPGVVVPMDRLIGACWVDPDCEPDDAAQAVRQRVHRVRAALEAVGVSRDRLKLRFLHGYSLKGERRVVRSYTLAEAARIDALVAADMHNTTSSRDAA